jgi:hypothetical protein
MVTRAFTTRSRSWRRCTLARGRRRATAPDSPRPPCQRRGGRQDCPWFAPIADHGGCGGAASGKNPWLPFGVLFLLAAFGDVPRFLMEPGLHRGIHAMAPPRSSSPSPPSSLSSPSSTPSPTRCTGSSAGSPRCPWPGARSPRWVSPRSSPTRSRPARTRRCSGAPSRPISRAPEGGRARRRRVGGAARARGERLRRRGRDRPRCRGGGGTSGPAIAGGLLFVVTLVVGTLFGSWPPSARSGRGCSWPCCPSRTSRSPTPPRRPVRLLRHADRPAARPRPLSWLAIAAASCTSW